MLTTNINSPALGPDCRIRRCLPNWWGFCEIKSAYGYLGHLGALSAASIIEREGMHGACDNTVDSSQRFSGRLVVGSVSLSARKYILLLPCRLWYLVTGAVFFNFDHRSGEGQAHLPDLGTLHFPSRLRFMTRSAAMSCTVIFEVGVHILNLEEVFTHWY